MKVFFYNRIFRIEWNGKNTFNVFINNVPVHCFTVYKDDFQNQWNQIEAEKIAVKYMLENVR